MWKLYLKPATCTQHYYCVFRQQKRQLQFLSKSQHSIFVSYFAPSLVVPFLKSKKEIINFKQNFSTLTKNNNNASCSSLNNLPSSANVVVIGGGVIGCSVAYHLAKDQKMQNVVLLERDMLTSGTTWHAAGLLTSFGNLCSTSMEMRLYTKELYTNILPNETDVETGYISNGFIELATNVKELSYYRRVVEYTKHIHGLDGVREITPDEILDKFPLARTDNGVIAGYYVPTDGRVNPTDVTMALAKGAKIHGVQVYQNVTVTDIITNNQHDKNDDNYYYNLIPTVTGVKVVDSKNNNKNNKNNNDNQNTATTNTTSSKLIEADVVVNCTGMWARQFGQKLNNIQSIPNQAAEHYYLITDDLVGYDDIHHWPVLEDPSNCIYIRPEGKGLLIGFFESSTGAAWNTNSIPNSFSFGEITPDWDRMYPFIEQAITNRLHPDIVDKLGIKTLFCGPESFTPDGSPIVGPIPELKNYYVAAGLNSVGILTGGGVGKVLAQWIANNGISPISTDVTTIHVNRFQPYHMNQQFRTDRVGETLANTYRLLNPDDQPETCRSIKHSPFHERLVTKEQANMKDVSGWESPMWYGTIIVSNDNKRYRQETGMKSSKNNGHDTIYGAPPPWFENWKQEHLACRHNVAVFDMSFMSKFLVQGKDAGAFLNYLSTANVDGNINTITYTQWLNELGYLEADLTISKLNDMEFLVIATDTMHTHVYAHMMKRLSTRQHVFVTDVTARYAQLNIQGPNSRKLLQVLSPNTNLSNEDFPFRHVQNIEIGHYNVHCARITYVGELGYELFIPVEYATRVHDLIIQAGEEYGLKHSGLKALGSLRLEKGYRDYGHDIDNTDTMLEAGLSFTCDFNKDINFIGQEHVLDQKLQIKQAGGLRRRIANILVNYNNDLSSCTGANHNNDNIIHSDIPLLYHGEVLYCNGQPMCDIRSASYGHSVRGGIGLAMLQSNKGNNNNNDNNEPLTKNFIQSAEWEINIGGNKYPCQVSLSPFYDPKNSKIKQ